MTMRLRPLTWLVILGLLAIAVVAGVRAADEIKVTARLDVDNGRFELMRQVSNEKYDQTEQGADYHIQTIGTNAEAITVIADVGTNGWAFIQNLTTNTDRTVDITLTLRLEAGEVFIGPLHPTNAVTATASSGTVDLECWINER